MPYDSRAVANHLLRLAKEHGTHLDNMKLQKLLYFAHGHWLGNYHRPLLDEVVQAWKFGPVVQTIYDEFREYGNNPITTRATNYSGKVLRLPWEDEGSTVREFLSLIWFKYAARSGWQLAEMTHAEGTPWREIYDQYEGRIPMFKEIPDSKIEEFFAKNPLDQELPLED